MFSEIEAWAFLRSLWESARSVNGEYVVYFNNHSFRGLCSVIRQLLHLGKISSSTSHHMLTRIKTWPKQFPSLTMYNWPIHSQSGVQSRLAFCDAAILECCQHS